MGQLRPLFARARWIQARVNPHHLGWQKVWINPSAVSIAPMTKSMKGDGSYIVELSTVRPAALVVRVRRTLSLSRDDMAFWLCDGRILGVQLRFRSDHSLHQARRSTTLRAMSSYSGLHNKRTDVVR